MLFSTWLRTLKARFQLPAGRRTRLTRRLQRKRVRLGVETLEDRMVLSAFTVTTTADNGDNTNPIAGSLRWAINQVNADQSDSTTNLDTIAFNISADSNAAGYAAGQAAGYNAATGVATIQPPSALPAIVKPVDINGYTQGQGTSLAATPNNLAGGENAVLKIDLDGSLTGTGAIGLGVNAPQSVVRGLDVTDWSGYGIYLSFKSSNSTVAGNFVGTDVNGEVAMANGSGPRVQDNTPNAAIVVNSANNLIGGTDPASRNLVSGNAADGIVIEDSSPTSNVVGNQVEGNFIGTDAAGTKALGNAMDDIFIQAGPTTIGGASPGARNIISGSTGGDGVDVGSGNGTVIEGNYIGTDVTGTKALGNANSGVVAVDDSNTTVGGTAAGAGNVISGNIFNQVNSVGSTGLVIQGNFIGTDASGKYIKDSAGNPLDSGTEGIFLVLSTGVFIGGTTGKIGPLGTAGFAGNLISGFSSGSGIDLLSSGNTVQGNLIGTDWTGEVALGNHLGIELRDNGNTIGGTTPEARNIISGNGTGIFANGASDNVIEGNYLGTDPSGAAMPGLGNGQAIAIGDADDSENNVIDGSTQAAGNLIANSRLDGIDLFGTTSPPEPGAHDTTISNNTIINNGGNGVIVGGNADGNSVLGNSIYGNGGLGIRLESATNANDNQAAPVLTTATTSATSTTVSGTLASLANTAFRIEFFSNQSPDPSGFGEGQTFLGYLNVTTDANGNASFTAALPVLPAGQTVLSATATKLVGTSLTPNDTSQFSNDVSIPSVGPITAPLTPVAINTTITTSASFTDGIPSTTHTAIWNWGDGNTSNGVVSESNGSGTVTGSHSYAVDGVYTVTLTVTNNGGGSGQSVFNYVVVYNPSAGFTTGGGWFNSPAGADTANPALTGKANFGFNARYQSGATVPTGQTEFQFPVANLDFKATRYDWLVINGSQAQYQGSGTINGAGNYGFLVTVTDNDANSGGGPDAIRIQIWDKSNNNAVVYDTQPGAAITAAPTTLLGGGDIQVHISTAKTQAVVNGSGNTITSGTPQPAPLPGTSNTTSPVIPVVTSTPAASASGVTSIGGDWVAFQTNLVDLLERDLSQWEAAMSQELASLTLIVDQLFADWERMALDSFGAIRPS